MPPTIDVPPEQLRLLRDILQEHIPGREVRIFGSRVAGRAKPMSDIDLCIMGDASLEPVAMDRLRTAFSESVLPWKADIVEWAKLSEAMRQVITHGSALL